MEDQEPFRITLPLAGQPQPRHRCRCIKRGPIHVGTPYYDSSTRAGKAYRSYRKRGAARVQQTFGDRVRFSGPLRLSCLFVIDRPSSRPIVPKTVTRKGAKVPNPRREAGEVMCSPELWKSGERIPCGRLPDLDNYIKALCDILTDAEVWWDDGQVVEITASKWYAAKGEGPSIEIEVLPW